MTDQAPDAAPPDHRDAKLAKVADAEKPGHDFSTPGHGANDPEKQDGPSSWSSTKLHGGD